MRCNQSAWTLVGNSQPVRDLGGQGAQSSHHQRRHDERDDDSGRVPAAAAGIELAVWNGRVDAGVDDEDYELAYRLARDRETVDGTPADQGRYQGQESCNSKLKSNFEHSDISEIHFFLIRRRICKLDVN